MIGEILDSEVYGAIMADLYIKDQIDNEIRKMTKVLKRLQEKKKQYYTFKAIAKDHGVRPRLIQDIYYDTYQG